MLWRANRQYGLAVIGGLAAMLAACTPSDNHTISEPAPVTPTSANGQCGGFGTFSGNITATIATAMSGCSLFVVSAGTDGNPVFSLLLTDGAMATPMQRVSLGRLGDRPDVGDYPLGEGAFSGLLTVIPDNPYFSVIPENHQFVLNGTVTITSSSQAAVDGRITLTGTDASGATVTITGTFSAKCAQVSGSTC